MNRLDRLLLQAIVSLGDLVVWVRWQVLLGDQFTRIERWRGR